jgi:hypothetical protein
MAVRKIPILLTLSIFGITAQAWAESVKSINNAVSQLTLIKMDVNQVVMLKRTEPTNEPTQPLQETKAKFQDINFLRPLREKKWSQWGESLDKVIYSYEFSQNAWKNKFLSPRQATETKPSRSDSGQSIFILKPYPDGNGYSEEGKIPTTLRLLQSKREEIFREIFMGLRFSFDLMNGAIFLEMNVTPSSEKGSGLIIRF